LESREDEHLAKEAIMTEKLRGLEMQLAAVRIQKSLGAAAGERQVAAAAFESDSRLVMVKPKSIRGTHFHQLDAVMKAQDPSEIQKGIAARSREIHPVDNKDAGPYLSEEELSKALALLGQDRWVQQELRHEVEGERMEVEGKLEALELTYDLEALPFVTSPHSPPCVDAIVGESLTPSPIKAVVRTANLRRAQDHQLPRGRDTPGLSTRTHAGNLHHPASPHKDAHKMAVILSPRGKGSPPRANRTTREHRLGLNGKDGAPLDEEMEQAKDYSDKLQIRSKRAWKGVQQAQVVDVAGLRALNRQKEATLAALIEKQEKELGLQDTGKEGKKPRPESRGGGQQGKAKFAPTTQGGSPRRVVSSSSARFQAVDLTWSSQTPPRGEQGGEVKFQTTGAPTGGTAQHALKMRQQERDRKAAHEAALGAAAKPSPARRAGGGGR